MPPGGGYWIDGVYHSCPVDGNGKPLLPKLDFSTKIERDESAQLYRKYFYGKVNISCVLNSVLSLFFISDIFVVLGLYGALLFGKV